MKISRGASGDLIDKVQSGNLFFFERQLDGRFMVM